MAKTRFYSMIISIPDDHRKHSTFTFSKYWNIISIPTYLGAVRTLREHTRRDGKGAQAKQVFHRTVSGSFESFLIGHGRVRRNTFDVNNYCLLWQFFGRR